MNLILPSILLLLFANNIQTKKLPAKTNIVAKQEQADQFLQDSIPSCISMQLGEGKDRKKLPHEFPNKNDAGENQYSNYTPAAYYNHLLSIPLNQSNKILRVYSTRTDPDASTLRLIVYDTKTKASLFITNIAKVTGSHDEGLFCPFAITEDDQRILLTAYMGDAGAGGGSVDYGYSMIPLKPITDTNYTMPEFKILAPRNAHFYDSYSKVVFTDEGNNTPHFIPPPYTSNNAALIYVSLKNNESRKTILEEKDKSYEILALDKQKKLLKLKVTSYTYTKDCPREEDALRCAEKKYTYRTITLP